MFDYEYKRVLRNLSLSLSRLIHAYSPIYQKLKVFKDAARTEEKRMKFTPFIGEQEIVYRVPVENGQGPISLAL